MHVNCAYLDLLLPVLFMLVITARQIMYSTSFQYSNCLIHLAFCYNIKFLSCNIPDWYPNGIAFVCLLFFFTCLREYFTHKKTMAGKGMQNLGLCSEPTHSIWDEGIFIMAICQLLWEGTLVYTVSFQGQPCLVDSYDKPGVSRTYSNQDPYEIKWCCNHDDISNVSSIS